MARSPRAKRQGICCAARFAKILLYMYNTIFWISGGAILAIGIYLRIDNNLVQLSSLVQLDKTENTVVTASYVLIGVGSGVFLVGLLGCCGVVWEKPFLLCLYIFFMLCIIGAEFAAGALAIIFRDKLEKELQLRLQKNIKEDYNTSSLYKTAWDFTQIKFTCCGAVAPLDYAGSSWYNTTLEQTRLTATVQAIPSSCCKTSEASFSNPVYIDEPKCQDSAFVHFENKGKLDAELVNVKGCILTIKQWIKDHLQIIIGVGCGVASFQILGFICACCLCHAIRRKSH